jgi:hypothetical protein
MIHESETVQKKSYQRYEWWDPPHQWTPIKNAAFYGRFIHSAHYIRSGDGQKTVTWTTDIETPGLYDVYAYMFSKEGFWRGRRRSRSLNFGEMNFTVFHESGTEHVVVSAEDAPEGWTFLGTWSLTKGPAKVILSDKSDARMVIADAVKWVKN